MLKRDRWKTAVLGLAITATVSGCSPNQGITGSSVDAAEGGVSTEQIKETNVQETEENKSKESDQGETEVAQIEPAEILERQYSIPEYIQLDVPEVLQKPELPTGCESVALTMDLMYEGFELDKTTIADEYLVYSEDGDFSQGYVGDPKSTEGAGCFPPTIAETANNFLEEQGSDKRASDITGTDFMELLETYVSKGIPVIIWHSMYMSDPQFTEEIYSRGGTDYTWYRMEHCVVLSGYDRKRDTVTVNDPLEGVIERDFEQFREIYEETGEFAVVIL